MKKIAYFMCTKCFEIHKAEIEINVLDLKGKSDFRVCNRLPINCYLECTKSKRMTDQQRKYILYKYEKLKGEGYKVRDPFICKGDLVEIDEKMLYAVQHLNIKGYDTQFCCSGHKDGDKANLLLVKHLHAMVFNLDPPEGWKWRYDDELFYPNTRPILECRLQDVSSNEHIYALNKWVDDLPNLVSK